MSVSQLAQAHGVNANLLFKWRRHYRAGLFDAPGASMALLPVSVIDASANLPHVESTAAPGAASHAGIEIAFDDCTLRIDRAADMTLVRAVLALLRR